ncbi:MAG: GNAT family N-acetyltransferase [Pseudomonadota bacterium]
MASEAPPITVRPVETRDFDGLRALYARVWDRARDERYDRMRFRDTMDGLPIAAVAEVEGPDGKPDIAGFFTLWPITLTDGSSIIPGGEAMDVMTDERLRGRGVFPSLAAATARFAGERGIQILFGAPNEAIFKGYLKKLSWSSPGFIRSFVRPLSAKGVAPLGGLGDPVLGIGMKNALAGHTVSHERPSDDALSICLEASEGARKNSVGGGVLRVRRTPEWYQFRYQDAGRFDYRWVTLDKGGELVGFAVWAIEIDQAGRMKRANLNDVIAPDDAAERALIALVANKAKQAGANFLHAVATSPARAPTFRKLGFIPLKKTPLIARTLDAASHSGNPFLEDGWDLIGGDFDFT